MNILNELNGHHLLGDAILSFVYDPKGSLSKWLKEYVLFFDLGVRILDLAYRFHR